jgi:very-short-patch-repair endonuclease
MHPVGALIVNPWAEAAADAARQHGVVHVRQLYAHGLSARAVAGAVHSGRLHRLHTGVYAVGHVPSTREARWMAAVLACGPGAALSHRNAAAHCGIREAVTLRSDVTVPPGGGRRRPGIVVHRHALEHEDLRVHDAIPVTAPARTLHDCTRDLADDEVARMLREAFHRRRLKVPELERQLARTPNRRLTAMIAGYADTRSHLEDAFHRLLDRHGIPRPLTQVPIAGHRVDFLWPAERVVVETDGWEAHSNPAAFQADRTLTNELQLRGYLVLRLTATDVRRRPARTARTIAVALAQRARG